MGIPTLIKTLTASDSASLEFVDGASDVVLDSTYDEYMFVFTDIHPRSNGYNLEFQVNATDDAGGGYDTSLITSTSFNASHGEAASIATVVYQAAHDLVQSANGQHIANDGSNDSDASAAGVMHLFSPSSTTYVKHFYARFNTMDASTDRLSDSKFTAGYINDTTAIDEIKFFFNSGNFDGVIQLYGIA